MWLYLSSFRLGRHPELLATLAGKGARVAVIAYAMDFAADDVRREAVDRELRAMSGLGFRPGEVDLRSYFGDAALLRRDLSQYDALWVRGGNVFVLRYALHRSGGDAIAAGPLAADTLVYAGYSAGPCVLAPSLRRLDAVDDPAAVAATYGAEPIWEGLGLLDYSIVPHYRSPDHPESTACDGVAAGYRAAGIAHRALRDGEALVIQGDGTAIW